MRSRCAESVTVRHDVGSPPRGPWAALERDVRLRLVAGADHALVAAIAHERRRAARRRAA